MVRDGIYYALAMLGLAAVLGWLTAPAVAAGPLLLAGFFLWFFRDPERSIPAQPGAIVSPADGTVTSVAPVEVKSRPKIRISIFLNIFNVHVNRSPVQGVVRSVEYRRGQFRNAMREASAEHNEQNIIALEGEGQTLIFKQIAGLLARRVVFTKRAGEVVARGERVGIMKFGSRADVILDSTCTVQVRVGEKVKGGCSILALAPVTQNSAGHETSAPAQVAGPVSGSK